jgi:hypothetical protein
MTWIPKERIWPTLIIAVLAGNLALGVFLFRLANDDAHFAVEPDYYRRAVGWDSTQAQARHNRDLGWTIQPTLGPLVLAGTTPLILAVLDAAGQPVEGARVTLEARHVAHAGEVVTAALAPAGPAGRYAAPLALARAGLWEFRVAVSRGAERFTDDLRLDTSQDAPAAVVTIRPGDAPPTP